MFFFFNDTATTEIYTLPLEKALCRSERVADTQIHTGRAGVGHTRRAADQADAGAVLVVHTRQPCVQRGALGELVDISDRILVGLAAAAREGRGVAAELGAGVLDAQEIGRAHV